MSCTLAEAIDTIGDRTSPKLTPRQRAAIFLVVQGHTYAEIGETLTITERTARAHVDRAREVLGCRTNREIVRMVWGRLAASSSDTVSQ